MVTAKVFWSGRSQAVRLPKEFRFATGTVGIKRRGNAVMLEPVPENWDWLSAVVGEIDSDFEQATQEELAQQKRPGLSLFE